MKVVYISDKARALKMARFFQTLFAFVEVKFNGTFYRISCYNKGE